VNDWFEAMDNAIDTKNWNLAASHLEYVKTATNAASADLIKLEPAVATLSGVRQTLGDPFANYLMGRSNILDKGVDAINKTIAAQVVSGKDSWVEGLKELRDKGANDEQSVMTLFDRGAAAITLADPKKPDSLKTAVKSLFGPDNRETVAKLGKPYDLQFYQKFTAPEIQQRILAIKESDPQSFKLYRNWAIEEGQALLQKDVSNLQQIVINDKDANVKFDDSTGKLVLVQYPKQRSGQAARDWQRQVDQYQEVLNRVNGMVTGLRPILEADNKTFGLESEVYRFLTDAGYDPHAVKTGTLFDQIGNAFHQKLGDVATSFENQNNRGPKGSAVAP
jgi:hypothetical protein